MRSKIILAASAAVLMTAGAAGAQAPGAPFPPPHSMGPGMGGMQRPPLPHAPQARPGRWGSQVGGRWWGGANAPGGWAAYRQPFRGYRVPRYWVAPRFYVTDWNRYGLYQPSGGYNWVRYYDDAILVDGSGGVQDWRGGLDWDAYDRSDYGGDGRGSDGVGGAIAGAVVGGVAGNVIAGRGNRLGGTLIGAGVGAAAGYGIDRATSRDRRVERHDDYREEYRDDRHGPVGPPPRDYHDSYRGPGAGYPMPPSRWHGDGSTTVTTVASGTPIIVQGGYGVTTITVQTAPVVTTTTTTETIEDTVTYTRRPVVRQRVWHARPKTKLMRRAPACACGS